MTPRAHSVTAVITTVVVAAAVAWGFVLAGSPGTRRQERIDRQRLQDLQTIAREIHRMVIDPENSTEMREPLPETLDEAAKRATDEKLNIHDPDTGVAYTYKKISDTKFELCATFEFARDSDDSVFWNHPAGNHCFTINVTDPPPFW
jgi:hypothetical protein